MFDCYDENSAPFIFVMFQISAKMDYRFIKGYSGGNLLYLENEKHLFVRKDTQKGDEVYICYHSILSKNRKNKKTNKPVEPNCTARVKISPDKICTRNKIAHTKHENHEIHFRDLESLNEMKKNCRLLKKIIPITSHKVSAKEIFLQEMAK